MHACAKVLIWPYCVYLHPASQTFMFSAQFTLLELKSKVWFSIKPVLHLNLTHWLIS